MLPDRVSNPGSLTYESGPYRLRYAARQINRKLKVVTHCKNGGKCSHTR